jgi:hypothetical protein
MKSTHYLAMAFSLAFAASPSYASPISFSETVTGSGSLNGVAFTDELITLSGFGDTSNVSLGSPDTLTLSSASVEVGSNTANFTDLIEVFSNSGLVGFTDNSVDILDTASAAFSGFNLTGPVSGTVEQAIFNPSAGFATTEGSFSIDATSGDDTFTAGGSDVLASTPEPSSLVLLATGTLGLVGAGRRRLRRY